jgi:Spy/CpxP family protein refolding chaperone
MRDDFPPEAQPPRDPTAREFLAGVAAAALLLALIVAGTLITTSCQAYHRAHHEPGEMREHAESMADRLLSRIDATEEQKAKVQTILSPLVADFVDTRIEHQAARAAVVAELTGSSIDREALEALRLERIKAFDELSRRIVGSVADIAEVLTREQRQELAELSERFHKRRRWHR